MNKRWRDAWYLVQSDLVRFKLGAGFTIIFTAYVAACSLMSLRFLSGETDGDTYMKIMLDFLMLALVPNFGFLFSRRSFRYIADDSYRKHLIKLRTLPIHTRTIVLSRYMSLSLNTLVNGLIFFTIQYLFIINVIEPIAVSQFVVYALTFIAYSVLMHTLFIQFEWRYSGKKYAFIVFMIMLATLIVAVTIGLTGNSLFLAVMELASHWPIPTAIIAVIVIAQTLRTGMQLSLRTLRKADLM